MNHDIDIFIEYDEMEKEYNGSIIIPFVSRVPRAISFESCSYLNDYDFMEAISGMRGKSSRNIPILFPRRSLPEITSLEVTYYVMDMNLEHYTYGWLYPDEVQDALGYLSIEIRELSIEIRAILSMLFFFAETIGSRRVRMLFFIR